MSVTREQVLEIVSVATENTKQDLAEQLNQLTLAVNRLSPPSVQSYKPVSINPLVSDNASLDLIKSLPEFKGDPSTYPAWRTAAHFAMKYYQEGSEKYYIAMGIFRNRITESANATLSSFNTVLNFNAIIARLDQSYSDKRPLYVLENELSVLRQDNLSISEYYDKVDKQLTLIINKQIMTHTGNDVIIAALNERSRENALRVFISGLRRPLCDILFSARPNDLPSALAVAQELEVNHRRHDFARAFAVGSSMKATPQYQLVQKPTTPITRNFQSGSSLPIPMEIDQNTSYYRRRPSPQSPLTPHHQQNKSSLRTQQLARNPQLHQSLPFQSVTPKRSREQSFSHQTPLNKIQKVNFMTEKESSNEEEFERYSDDYFLDGSQNNYDVDNDYQDYSTNNEQSEEINFLY